MTRKTLVSTLAVVAWLAAGTAQAVTCQNGNPASNPDSIYIVHGDGTVTDTRTGLMWKQCLEGQSGADCSGGSATAMTQDQARDHALGHTFAGYSNWRLPRQFYAGVYYNELGSLVEACRNAPAINDSIFGAATPSSFVWGTSYYQDWGGVKGDGVNFNGGVSTAKFVTEYHHVRLVRNVLPALSAVALQGTPTASSATVAGTSSLAATGYWLVVPQGSTAPTPAQVRAQAAAYGSVTPVAQGSAAMLAATPASFAITSLTAATDYDFYLVADAAGQLSTPVQKVAFTTAAAPVAGTCGSAHNTASTPLLASAPAANLCNAGSPGPITGNNGTWDWTCSGSPTATCQAPRGYTVTPTAGAGGGISPATAQTVAYGATPAFTVTPGAGHAVASVTGCGGALAGSTFTTGAVTAACTVSATFAPLTHAVTATASPVAGGSAVCSGSVNQGATATCTATATASAGYQFHGWTGACAGQGAVCSLANVTASQASVALFTQQPAGLTLPEGPYIGQTLGLALQPGNGWQVTQAGTETVASLSAPALPPGVTLPHGVVRLELRHGTQASTATVVLTYPQALPAGAAYYKYGKTRDDATPHWYAFPGAAISGNTVTLTLKDGWAGDGDVTENGVIQDPGGVALVAASPAATAAAIPTLGEWALALLAGALGLFTLGALRRRA